MEFGHQIIDFDSNAHLISFLIDRIWKYVESNFLSKNQNYTFLAIFKGDLRNRAKIFSKNDKNAEFSFCFFSANIYRKYIGGSAFESWRFIFFEKIKNSDSSSFPFKFCYDWGRLEILHILERCCLKYTRKIKRMRSNSENDKLFEKYRHSAFKRTRSQYLSTKIHWERLEWNLVIWATYPFTLIKMAISIR